MKRFVWLLLVMMPMLSYLNFATEDVNDLIIEGNSQLSSGNYPESIKYFNRVLEIDVQNCMAFYGKGMAYEKLNYIDTAIYNYRKAVYYKDDFSLAFYRSGVLKYNLKLFSQALKDFENVTKLNPDNLEAILYTAYCFEKMGFFIYASELYKKLAEMSTSHKEFILKSCKTRIGYEAFEYTIRHFDSLLINEPKYDSAFYFRGICKLNAGMFLPAINDFSRAIYLNDKFTEAYIYRGRAKQMIDSKNSKVENEDLIYWKQIRNDFIDVELEKAYNYYYDSSYYQAIEHFNNVLATNSARTDAMLFLGLCNYGIKNYSRAKNYSDMVLNLSPHNLDALLLKANIFLGIENENAINYIQPNNTIYLDASEIMGKNSVEYIKNTFSKFMAQERNNTTESLIDSINPLIDNIIKIDSLNYYGYLIRAESSSNNRSDSIAEYCYTKAIELSNDPEYYLKRGLFYLKKKKYNKSLDDFIKSYELGYKTLEIQILKIILSEMTDRDTFWLADRSSVFGNELLNVSANYLYGYYKLEYFEDSHTAIKYFEKAIELDPYYYDSYNQMKRAKNYKKSGKRVR
jgi:tetratricopeptide (TPR) repeat protein